MDYIFYHGWGREESRVIPDTEWTSSIDLDNEAWQFYALLVIKRADGYYLTTDSGCSCPTPFENHTWPEDFTGPLTADQAREEVNSLVEHASRKDRYAEGPDEYEVKDLLAKIV